MKIVKNDNFLINNFESTPIFKVVDENDNTLYEGVTLDECQNYIENNKTEKTD